MKAVVAAYNQEKALVGAFSVIVQLHRLIIYSTTNDPHQMAARANVVVCSPIAQVSNTNHRSPGLGAAAAMADSVHLKQ